MKYAAHLLGLLFLLLGFMAGSWLALYAIMQKDVMFSLLFITILILNVWGIFYFVKKLFKNTK
jgi:membrane protein DedA with SNARE-associated domain